MEKVEPPSLKQPIVVVGSARSGTSFLSRLLSEHSQLAMLVEPRLTWKYGNDSKSDLLKASDARPEVINHIRRTFSEYVEAAGKGRLGEKTPSNALRMEFVDRVLPDAKFVNVIRHGKDSALSIRGFWEKSSVGFAGVDPGRLRQRLKEIKLRQVPYYGKEFLRRVVGTVSKSHRKRAVWGPRLPGMEAWASELHPLEMACLQWRTCVEMSCAYGRQLPVDRYLELRLESLDENAIERMLDFCGLSNEPALEAHYKEKFVQSKAGARRRNVTEEEDQILECWLRPTLDWLGYRD